VTITTAVGQSAYAPDSRAHKTPFATVNFDRYLAERWSTPI